MISADTERQLDKLYNNQPLYRPQKAIRDQLASKSITMIIGATCEGKSTAMQRVTELDTRFAIAGSFTSRQPRPSDGAGLYTYFEHSDTGLATLLKRIQHHEVLNYAVNPFSKQIYGSELTDYPNEYNVGDFFSASVAGFSELGFRNTIVISIITDPKVWLGRFDARFPPHDPQRAARKQEAIQSFEWSLAQPEDSYYWVENIDGQPDNAAQQIIAITLRTSRGDTAARELAVASLATAKNIAA